MSRGDTGAVEAGPAFRARVPHHLGPSPGISSAPVAGGRRLRPTCRDVISTLMEYLEATLEPGVVAALDEHLATCAECLAYVATYRKTRKLTGEAGEATMRIETKARLRGLLAERLGQPRNARARSCAAPGRCRAIGRSSHPRRTHDEPDHA